MNLLTSTINKYKATNKEIILCGDFNTDFSRNNTYGTILREFANRHSLIPIDLFRHQSAQYTYFKKFKNMIIRTWIDHIFIPKDLESNVSYIKILDKSDINVGDHNPLVLIYELKLSTEEKTIVKDACFRIKEPNWLDENQRSNFALHVINNTRRINELVDIHRNTDCEEKRTLLATELFTEITYVLTQASTKTREHKLNEKRNKKFRSNSFGWSEELMILHRDKCKKFTLYKDSNWNDDFRKGYYEAKKLFKTMRKIKEREKAYKKFKRLDDQFKNDINGFWRQVRRMKETRQNITVPLEDIKEHYSSLFNISNYPDEERDRRDEEKLSDYIRLYKASQDMNDYVVVDQNELAEVIGKLKNGKAVGFSGVTNEMLKYGSCTDLIKALKYIYEWMINTARVPKLFNLSVLKALIKDEKKSSGDINNLRPLSISDIYTNLLEKIVLKEVRKDHKDHDKQFGFRANASCGHATFLLSEIIRLNRKRGETTYVVSIDASKAFDRVNRTKLWLTMFEYNIRPRLIMLLM